MFGREPAVVLGALSEIVKAIIPMLIIFGILQWTDNQVAAVMLVVSVVVGSLTSVLTRSQVVPTIVADRQIDIALKAPSTTSPATVMREAQEQL